MRKRLAILLTGASAFLEQSHGQVLIDSIPYPGQGTGFWGIHVSADTIFLGSDFDGGIHFSDHDGNIAGTLPTGLDFNHGLVRRPGSYLIAEDYSTGGAGLYEVDLSGNLINSWTFPDVIGGPSSGIGDLEADGNAIWYTMYYPDFDVYPFAYAYKWIPGDPAPIDTVPMNGEQPYGIAIKGDTLFYVTDNLNGDEERIYAYDLANGQDLGWIGLPDTPIDNDQRPQGMYYDGEFLYQLANRQGGSAFAYQTIFIYSFEPSTAIWTAPDPARLQVYPTPAHGTLVVENPALRRTTADLVDAAGLIVERLVLDPGTNVVDIRSCTPGMYTIRTGSGMVSKVLVR